MSEPNSSRYAASKELFERAQHVLAGGVSSEFRKFAHPHPLFFTRGAGARIEDVDGNEYLDFTLSQGPLILGHSPASVLEAVREASADGQIFAGQHLRELELAEKLVSLIPCAELLRMSLSGSECVHAALRLARAATGRPKFLRFEGHYHGWYDNVASGVAAADEAALGSRENPNLIPWTEGLPARVAEETLVLPWNDLALLEQTLSDRHEELAAVITEPVMCNSGCIPPKPGFLEGLRALCDQYGIVLIFDEVITGFRVGLGGAQARLGVTPDLAVFGKAMANGYPISALAGKRSLMDLLAQGRVIHAGTMNSGNPCVAAALATIAALEEPDVYPRIYRLGERLMQGLRQAAAAAGHEVLLQGLGPMFHLGFTSREQVSEFRETFAFDKPKYAAFSVGMQERGVRLIGRGLWYISAVHRDEDIDACLAAATEVFTDIPEQ